MEKNQVQWSQGYGNGIFLNDQETKIAENVATVTLPDDFMQAHYARLPQFKYSPDFTDYRPLATYALYRGQYYNPRVELSNSADDFSAANEASGFAEKPGNYTWYHLFDAAGSPGILQLVNTKIHQRSCPLGLDCGGDVIVADEQGKLYLLSHETNEIESLSDDAPYLEKFL